MGVDAARNLTSDAVRAELERHDYFMFTANAEISPHTLAGHGRRKNESRWPDDVFIAFWSIVIEPGDPLVVAVTFAVAGASALSCCGETR